MIVTLVLLALAAALLWVTGSALTAVLWQVALESYRREPKPFVGFTLVFWLIGFALLIGALAHLLPANAG